MRLVGWVLHCPLFSCAFALHSHKTNPYPPTQPDASIDRRTPNPQEQNNSVALELQRVFYSLQTRPKAVGTLSLTKAFGWSTADAFVQHDIQVGRR